MMTILRLSALLLAGRKFWILPLLPLLWLLIQALLLLVGASETFEPAAAQNTLIGIPAAVLSVFLGGRVITGELDQRSLEIAYTVPGGAHRVWLGKMAAAALILLSAILLQSLVTYAFFTSFPIAQSIYGALQGVTFYLVTAMGFATLLRSEVAGALATVSLLGLNGLITGFGANPLRISPFWNPLSLSETDSERLLALALQNRIGVGLAIAAIVALTFARAERREKMLSG